MMIMKIKNLNYFISFHLYYEINQFWILGFYVRMNHFEAHLIVLSIVNSKALMMAIQLSIFSDRKGKAK